jgi:hypothetical protein
MSMHYHSYAHTFHNAPARTSWARHVLLLFTSDAFYCYDSPNQNGDVYWLTSSETHMQVVTGLN